MTQPMEPGTEEFRETQWEAHGTIPDAPITANSPEWKELRAEVNFIYAFMTGFAAALGKMTENPMMRTMGRQFGMDLDGLKGLVPPTNGE